MMARFPQLLRTVAQLPRAPAKLAEIRRELATARAEREEVRAALALVPHRNVPPFPVWDATEPTVRAAIYDLAGPTDTVFDVGAHIGGLSSILSRTVGPNGQVIAFEASAATAAQLNTNMVANGYRNVTIFHGAVYSRSGMLVSLSDNGAASRVSDDGVELVETIQLDELCRDHGLAPSFMKMDIEGAEFEALQGAETLLREVRPHIVFEHNIGDDRALNLLRASGYVTYDAARYVPVASSQDFEPGAHNANAIAIHRDRIGDTPYCRTPTVTVTQRFEPVRGGNLISRHVVTLEPGRYVFEVDKQPVPAQASVLYSRVSFNGAVIGQLWTGADFFMQNHRHLPFQARHAGQYTVEIGEISSNAGMLGKLGATLHKITLAVG